MSSKDKRKMSRELKDSRKATVERMERFLAKEQMKEFKAIQREREEALKERLGD